MRAGASDFSDVALKDMARLLFFSQDSSELCLLSNCPFTNMTQRDTYKLEAFIKDHLKLYLSRER